MDQIINKDWDELGYKQAIEIALNNSKNKALAFNIWLRKFRYDCSGDEFQNLLKCILHVETKKDLDGYHETERGKR